MSGKLVGMVFDHYHGSGSELLLAVKLADNAHDDGTHIYPSVDTLARQTRQSDRTIQRQLGRMVESGWLVLVREARGGGRGAGPGRPREYRIHPDFVNAFDTRTPESERPTWPPHNASLQTPGAKEMGDILSPISGGKWVTPGAEMGDTAVSEMGDTAMSPEPSRTVSNNTPLPPTGGAPGFEAVFAEYPRQVAKARALQEWHSLNPDEPTQRRMLQSIAQWRSTAEWQREEGRFIPKFSRWLAERRWLDVPGLALAPAKPAEPTAPPLPTAPPSAEVRARMDAIRKAAGRRPARQPATEGA